MAKVDIEFCFYDDPAYLTDADRDSSILREWHKHLWSKELPNGDELVLLDEPGTGGLTLVTPRGQIRASSDTIATTHSSYARFGISELWAELDRFDQERYDRGFYTIGGFTIFPTHTGSLNQRRGTSAAIADRFDLTLECIREHYVGKSANPLTDVLAVDADFSDSSGRGRPASPPTSTSST